MVYPSGSVEPRIIVLVRSSTWFGRTRGLLMMCVWFVMRSRPRQRYTFGPLRRDGPRCGGCITNHALCTYIDLIYIMFVKRTCGQMAGSRIWISKWIGRSQDFAVLLCKQICKSIHGIYYGIYYTYIYIYIYIAERIEITTT